MRIHITSILLSAILLSTTALAAKDSTNIPSRKQALIATERFADCARCGKNFQQFATCVDFLATKSVIIMSEAFGDGRLQQELARKLDQKLFAAQRAGLTGQGNSDYCKGIVSRFYKLDRVIHAECTTMCRCRGGVVGQARAKTFEGAFDQARSQCAEPSDSCSPGCSCKNCPQGRGNNVSPPKFTDASVQCVGNGSGGVLEVPCA